MVNMTNRQPQWYRRSNALQRTFLQSLLVLCTSYAVYAQGTDSAAAPDSVRPKVCFTLNASPQLNLYSAAFDALPGVPNCCTEFTNTAGIGFSLAAGIESVRDQHLFGRTMRYGLALRYSQLGANFVEENVDANVIVGNTAVKGISEHRINVSLSGLLAEPYIAWTFFHPSLQLLTGIQAGTYLGASFAQKETLLSPGSAVFETGTTVRNEQSGSLPNKQSMYLGATIGLRYLVSVRDNLEFLPELSFHYGLTPVISNLDWKISALQAGLTVRYTIVPRKEVPPPPPVLPPRKPMVGPKPPIVQIKREVHLQWQVSYANQAVKQDGVYELNQPARVIAQRDMPVDKVFFAKNETESLNNDQDLLLAIAEMAKADSTLVINMLSTASADEEELTAQARAAVYQHRLQALGIAASRVESRTQHSPKQKYPELDEEQRTLQFRVMKRAEAQSIVRQRRDTVVIDDPNPPRIVIRSRVTSDIKTYSPMLTTAINGEEIQSVLDSVKTLGFDPLSLRSGQAQHVALRARVMDEDGNKDTVPELRFTVQPHLQVDSLVENVVSDSSARFIEFVLGYCDFDKVPLYTIDEAVLPRIRAYAEQGRAIEVVAMTDNLGSEAHNEQLANARAREAVRLLNLPKGASVHTRLVPGGLYGNDSAKGRTQNRGVVVRISLHS